ncbi:MAG: hypothetical protein ACOYXR_06855 [Nitrospirota bacterium]
MTGVRHAAKRVSRALGFRVFHHGDLRANRRFRSRHRGERCFILCNGPSVLKQDLTPLRNEVVMSVSSGYLHTDFHRISPAYHFVPPVTYGVMQEEDFVRWFKEMDGRLGRAELFLGSSEYHLVKGHALFPTRRVNYLCSARPFWPGETRIIDICGLVPVIGSVPIMCLMVALYMGFAEIYLLGTDHDSLITREYKYSFEPTVLRGKDFAVDDAGSIKIPLYEELNAYVALWTQYRHLKRIARANGVTISNATVGGMLDEFPRVQLAEIIGQHKPTTCEAS